MYTYVLGDDAQCYMGSMTQQAGKSAEELRRIFERESSNMATPHDVLLQYRELCSYCDSFFVRIERTYSEHMRCARGCAQCCTLETVCALEAYAIALYMQRCPMSVCEETHSQCGFLCDGQCSVYPVRPIICRTHGMAITVPGETRRDCCPLNFSKTSLTALPEADVLDITRITQNLLRLNLALCMLIDNRPLSGKRILLHDVAGSALPPPLQELLSAPKQ